ncbi:MAG: hypothetical protein OEU32_07385 [Acidimicrobiia bacterium]|nr:hypothetical protein [Acidimicrobiia bacterium]
MDDVSSTIIPTIAGRPGASDRSATATCRGKRRRAANRARAILLPDEGLRAWRTDLIAWTLAEGRSLGPDAATAVLGVLGERGGPGIAITDDLITELVWVDVLGWCNAHRVDAPTRLATTMHTIVDHLDARAALGPGSDSVGELHECIESAGGFDAPAPRSQRPPPA